jgi:predicted transcriptional regulator
MYGLGELESAVMDVLWETDEPAKVRMVLNALDRKLAYTTVMTVLDNLHRKGWVQREQEGIAYRYQPSFSREQAVSRALRTVLESTGNPLAALLHFASTATERESEALRSGLQKKPRVG